MILPPIVGSTIGVISRGFDGILGWIEDHLSGAPIMSERINKGSDRFFAAEKDAREKGGVLDLSDVFDDVGD